MTDREPTITDRIEETPALKPGRLREVKPRDLVVRFVCGAAASVAAGVVTLAFGARTGGIVLAFPAILAASLTLIEEEQDGEDAREDSRGAVAGAVALTGFALVCALLLTRLAAPAALAIATGAWLLVALAIYAVAWFRRSSPASRPTPGAAVAGHPLRLSPRSRGRTPPGPQSGERGGEKWPLQ